MATALPATRVAIHPLEPLNSQEIAAAVEILGAERRLGPRMRFVTITLNEPPKPAVLAYQPGNMLDREAFVICSIVKRSSFCSIAKRARRMRRSSR